MNIAVDVRRSVQTALPSLLWFTGTSALIATTWGWFLTYPFGIPLGQARVIAYFAMVAIGLFLGITRARLYVVGLSAAVGVLTGFAWAEARMSDVYFGTF